MAMEWSDTIVITELADEPALSEDMHALLDRLQAASDRVPHVVLNFGQVTYVNSSNLAQLLRLKKVLHERDAQLRLCSLSDQVWSVFMVTGLDKIFRFAPDPMTALASLQMEDERNEGGRR
ncbi:MAG: STAS domain-containing protein [Planctomycetota bacterium]|nr:STAS domain-containing protein [Planctomycetota bacterium]